MPPLILVVDDEPKVARLAREPRQRAEGFLAWLRGPEARAILRRHGFSEP